MSYARHTKETEVLTILRQYRTGKTRFSADDAVFYRHQPGNLKRYTPPLPTHVTLQHGDTKLADSVGPLWFSLTLRCSLSLLSAQQLRKRRSVNTSRFVVDDLGRCG